MEYILNFLFVFCILCIIDTIVELWRVNGWYDSNDKTIGKLYEYAIKNDIDPDSFKELLNCVPIEEYEFSGVVKIFHIIYEKMKKSSGDDSDDNDRTTLLDGKN